MTLRLRSTYKLRGNLETAGSLELDLGGAARERITIEEAAAEGRGRLLVVESVLDDPLEEEVLIGAARLDAEQQAKARELGDRIEGRHGELANRTHRFLRWRLNLPDDAQPLGAAIAPKWQAEDGREGPLPRTLTHSITFTPTATRAVIPPDTATRVLSGPVEPLGHELIREALLLVSSAPRGALVLGIAALEAGIKGYIVDRAPHTAWLLQKTPSPPVADMLEKYVPELPAQLTLNGRVIAPPKAVMKDLRVAIEARNQLVHRGEIDVKNELVYSRSRRLRTERLTQLLVTVRDVLYLLDAYRGEGWAAEYIGPEMRRALTATSLLPNPKPAEPKT